MTQAVHATLAGHPDNPPVFMQDIGATLLQKSDGSLAIAYAIHGPTDGLRIPAPDAPAPAEALWRTTCCELFVGTTDAADYREFNFSPSGQWAVYDFSDYRDRTPAQPRISTPSIRSGQHADRLRLDALLPPTALPKMSNEGGILCFALAVVLESNDGSLGYWALAHPAGKPDFHHRAGFALQLDSPEFGA
ncbi:MAG: DOMON-like domain-containing protein [Rhodocyclaceae bacterium]|nr:DOMON-like domain-containing protein [Rhodocyclaceae bacterium]